MVLWKSFTFVMSRIQCKKEKKFWLWNSRSKSILPQVDSFHQIESVEFIYYANYNNHAQSFLFTVSVQRRTFRSLFIVQHSSASCADYYLGMFSQNRQIILIVTPLTYDSPDRDVPIFGRINRAKIKVTLERVMKLGKRSAGVILLFLRGAEGRRWRTMLRTLY